VALDPVECGCHPGGVAESSLANRALASGLVQPDQTTCGSCVLVVARMLNDPSYAAFLVNGANPATGQRAAGTLQVRFQQQAMSMHRLTSGFKDSEGVWQLPWPRALGTQPWAVAREMTHRAGATGKRYVARPILRSQRSRIFKQIASLAGTGNAIPLYVGNRWSPRHVVLVLPADGPQQNEVLIYDPASGRRYPIDADDFSAGRLRVAGWQVPWAVVVPT
jgi:hypothetical protein